MWILTNSFNEYDQYGDYFRYAWKNKPSKEGLRKAMSKIDPDFLSYGEISEESLDHLLAGGGRRNDEYIWYELFEFKP